MATTRRKTAAVQEEIPAPPPPLPTAEANKNRWRENLPWILFGLVILVLAWIILKKDPDPKPIAPDNSLSIELLRRLAEAEQGAAYRDSVNRVEKQQLAEYYLRQPATNKHYYIESKKKYDEVRPNIMRMSNDSLRRRIAKLLADTSDPR